MRIRINIDFEIGPRTKRALRIAVPAALILAGSIAYASVPNVFKEGDALSAQTMNDNFSALDQRIAKLESFANVATHDAGWSVNGTFCAQTANTTKGDLSGITIIGTSYGKGRAACQQTCGTPTAHMCSGEELTRSVQLGIPQGTGWFSPGVSSGAANVECVGWTNGTAGQSGAIWRHAPGTYPSYSTCDTTLPVLCCD